MAATTLQEKLQAESFFKTHDTDGLLEPSFMSEPAVETPRPGWDMLQGEMQRGSVRACVDVFGHLAADNDNEHKRKAWVDKDRKFRNDPMNKAERQAAMMEEIAKQQDPETDPFELCMSKAKNSDEMNACMQ